jgi:hypothetical protein
MLILRLAAIPLRLAPALTIALLSAALTLAYKAGPFGWPLTLILLSWLFRYSFAFLDSMIGGAREAPVLSVEMLLSSLGEWRSLLPLGIAVAIFFGSGATSFWLGTLLTVIACLAVILLVPAVIAIQGWTGKTRQSLSPIKCFLMARLLGRDYFGVAGVATLLAAASALALHPSMPLTLRIAVLCFSWLVLIALIGGIVHRRRDALENATEFHDKNQPVISPTEIARRREEAFDAIYAAWRGGAQENAWQALGRHVAASEDPLAELRIIYRRVSAWERPQFAHRVAQELLVRLVDQRREGEALALARERLAVDAKFRPRTSVEVMRLARYASAASDKPTARTMLSDFAAAYPGDALSVEATQLLQALRQ